MSISWIPIGSWTSRSNLDHLRTLVPPSNSVRLHTFWRWRAMDISFVPPHSKAIFFQLNSLSKTSVICTVETAHHTQWLAAHRSMSNSRPPVDSQRHFLENDCHRISETIYAGLSLRPEGEGFYYLTWPLSFCEKCWRGAAYSMIHNCQILASTNSLSPKICL
jgi:hypothetical protein